MCGIREKMAFCSVFGHLALAMKSKRIHAKLKLCMNNEYESFIKCDISSTSLNGVGE